MSTEDLSGLKICFLEKILAGPLEYFADNAYYKV
jgi:hypothetical protein